MAVLADFHEAEVDLGRLGLQFRLLHSLRRKFRDELIEAAFEIRKRGRLLRSHGEIDAAHAAEEGAEEALAKEVHGRGPVLLARHGELIEVATRKAVRKDEGIRERRSAGVDRPARPTSQGRAVIVAVRRFRRIDARALRTNQTHSGVLAGKSYQLSAVSDQPDDRRIFAWESKGNCCWLIADE